MVDTGDGMQEALLERRRQTKARVMRGGGFSVEQVKRAGCGQDLPSSCGRYLRHRCAPAF